MYVSPAGRLAIRLALLGSALFGPAMAVAGAAEPVKWRTDYATARKEAQERGLPLFVAVGTDECFYCRKLENGPFRDPAVAALLAGSFVPLKIDANREPALARALKVTLYPTLVMAGHDGKIHAFQEGYLEAERLREQLKRTVAAATTPDGAARDFQEATRAIAAGEYARAVSLLNRIVEEVGTKPVGARAKEVLEGLERQAATRLVVAKELEERGHSAGARDAFAELMRAYAGTQAAADAATFVAGLGDRPEKRELVRLRRARELLGMAREEFRTDRFYDCLQHCDRLEADFADLAEAKEAASLAADVKANPERLAAACEQSTERTVALYLKLAESWQQKGQPREAATCLEKVVKLSPQSRQAEDARVRLAKIQGREPTVTTGFLKPLSDR